MEFLFTFRGKKQQLQKNKIHYIDYGEGEGEGNAMFMLNLDMFVHRNFIRCN